MGVADLLKSCIRCHSSSLTDSLKHLETSHFEKVIFKFFLQKWILSLLVVDKGVLANIVCNDIHWVS
jgi:hypothetical protein